MDTSRPFTYYEFFAGGGMARLGLGPSWRCLFANDWSERKAQAYLANFGRDEPFFLGDIRQVSPEVLPGWPDLVWGSFPCQDLSLAGPGTGLSGTRSGTVWPFWELVLGLARLGRKPPVVVLENVVGALSSNGGSDFAALIAALVDGGYRAGAVVANASDFLPQSRPRLFIVAADSNIGIPDEVASGLPFPHWHPLTLRSAVLCLSGRSLSNWIWWNLPLAHEEPRPIDTIVELDDDATEWHSIGETERLLELMGPLHRSKLLDAQHSGRSQIGFAYRRTRVVDGIRKQQIEIRFDGTAGCLRTPAGGSSRQIVFVVDGSRLRSRLLTAREAARLMGIPDSYKLPENYNDAYELAGDGVAVPVVSWIERHLLRPLAQTARMARLRAEPEAIQSVA
jgi:DNA (cytosine-5)-methyltransferase 1